MTRHFLRDKNGEEAEIAPLEGYPLVDYDLYVSQDGKNFKRIEATKREIWINQKLEFIVWQEV